jgi:hypothetical protein
MLMQAAMWLIFGGTLALAALVDRHHDPARQIELAEPVTHGDLIVRVPAGWQVAAGNNAGAGARDERSAATVVVEARELGARQATVRLLTISRQRTGGELISPLEFLYRTGAWDTTETGGAPLAPAPV